MSAEVPKGWHEGRLRDLCEPVERRLGPGAKLPMLSVTKRGVIPQSETYDKEISSADVSNYRVIEPGEFGLAPMALYYGAIGRHWGNSPGIISPAYSVFRHADNVDPCFLDALVRRPRMVSRYDALSQGGNLEGKRKSTPFEAFRSVRVYYPPLTEQKAIADVLSSIDATISQTQDLISSVTNVKYSTMAELLTRGPSRKRARLKALPGRWILGRVSEGITHIPEEWELVRLTKVAKLESGHTPDRTKPSYWGGSIPWISLQDAESLGQLVISETAEMIAPEGLKNSSARMLPAGTVVLQRTANIGLASVMGREMCTSQHFANWVCGPRIDPLYLQQVFRHMSREWRRLMAGSVLPDIYMSTFKALQILLPPLAEQRAIGEIGAAFDRRLERETGVLNVLTECRTAVAEELLSGRTRLPETMVAKHQQRAVQAA